MSSLRQPGKQKEVGASGAPEAAPGAPRTLCRLLNSGRRSRGDGRCANKHRGTILGIPLLQMASVGSYVARKEISGTKRYPLVLMLEPLFRCNLACAGCGKIDYPDKILNERLPLADALHAMDECGAPVVVIAGGEPLPAQGAAADGRRCDRQEEVGDGLHQRSSARKASAEIQAQQVFQLVGASRRRQGHARQVRVPEGRVRQGARRLEEGQGDGLSGHHQLHALQRCRSRERRGASSTRPRPGVSRASRSRRVMPTSARPTSSTSSIVPRPRSCSARSSPEGKGGKAWPFYQSILYMDFLAGNQKYNCTPWGNPTLTVFGWQKPCYLLGEGYVKTFKELMDGHGLGQVRHGQLREVRRLHGPLRVRGFRGDRLVPQAVEACSASPPRAFAPKARWRRRSRSPISVPAEFMFLTSRPEDG